MLDGAKRPSNSDDNQYHDDNEAIQDVAKRSPMLDEAIQNGAMRPPMLDGAIRPLNSDDNDYRDDNDAFQDVTKRLPMLKGHPEWGHEAANAGQGHPDEATRASMLEEQQ